MCSTDISIAYERIIYLGMLINKCRVYAHVFCIKDARVRLEVTRQDPLEGVK